jgi:hypothetical protein
MSASDPKTTCAPAPDRLQSFGQQDKHTVLPMLKLKKVDPRGCDAADCGLARKARHVRVRRMF